MSLSLLPIPSDSITMALALKLSTSRFDTVDESASSDDTVNVPAMLPVTTRSPSIVTFSFKLILELSALEILVPLKLNASMSTPAVPLPVIVTDELVVSDVMLSLFTDRASISTLPVPLG